MQAYEFNAVVRNGQIQIPEKLSVEKLSNVRVILLADSAKNAFSTFSQGSKFTAMRLKTKGFTFDREEIHER
jgi:hypothetical protein